jgi:hypothetical protein
LLVEAVVLVEALDVRAFPDVRWDVEDVLGQSGPPELGRGSERFAKEAV